MKIREALFALRVVRRRDGQACILYRRRLSDRQIEELDRVGAISPLAMQAGLGLIRTAVKSMEGQGATLSEGPFHSLDEDWGARVACYALASSGLRDPIRLGKAAGHIQAAAATEAAWWLGLMQGNERKRNIRAFRIMAGAVK